MRRSLAVIAALVLAVAGRAQEPKVVSKPDAFPTLVNPNCSHCRDEAKRRARAGDLAGAVSALSTVIEEFPGRTDALRLVGYRLVDLKRAGAAVGLFRQVQRSRHGAAL